MFAIKRRIYESLPVSLKAAVGIIPFSLVAGRCYRVVRRRGRWVDRASAADLAAYRDRKLGEMLRYATAMVPAYSGMKWAVERYRPFDALQEFPIIDKDIVQENLEKFLPVNIRDRPHYETTTGGTSGNQLKIYLDDNSQSIEMAFMHRQWARVGYTTRCRKATFRGVPFPNLKAGVFWQLNPIYGELQFSPFHMSEENLHSYVERLIAYRPQFLHGYPSALDILSEFVLRNRLCARLPPIKAALLGSEGATQAQRQRIEAAFRCRAYSWYGHSERIILAGECEVSDTYHQFPDYGVLELIDVDGGSCKSEGCRGEIVGTGLLNKSMPLIRYRTGDFATYAGSYCDCGRHWDRFSDVQGRWQQEMFYGHGGAKFSLAALNMHGPLFDKVKRYQYVQTAPGVCTLNVMVSDSFGDDDRAAIERALHDKVGGLLTFEVRVVESIPLTSRGKLKMLVSSLN